MQTADTLPAASSQKPRARFGGVVVAIAITGMAAVIAAMALRGSSDSVAMPATVDAAPIVMISIVRPDAAPPPDATVVVESVVDARSVVSTTTSHGPSIDAGTAAVTKPHRHAREQSIHVDLDAPPRETMDDFTTSNILDEMKRNILAGCGPWQSGAAVHAKWFVFHGYVHDIVVEHASDADQERCIREAWQGTHFWPANEDMEMSENYP
jgi:hypothetical protein